MQVDVDRLTELCADFLGPLSAPPSSSDAAAAASGSGSSAATAEAWQPTIMGRDKRAVLKDVVLPLLMACPPVTKVAVDFSERLRAATS